MAFRDEQELLRRLRESPSPSENGVGGEAQANSDVKRATVAFEKLRLAFEAGTNLERFEPAREAHQTWKSLSPTIRDRFIYLLSGTWTKYFLAGAIGKTQRIAAILERRGKQNGRPALQAEGLLAGGVWMGQMRRMIS